MDEEKRLEEERKTGMLQSMPNTGLDEAQAGIKIAGRNINNLRYAYGSTPMEERKEELMKVKEESEKVGFQIAKIMASSPIISWQILIEGKKVEAVIDFIFLDSKITTDGDCNHEIKRCLLLGRKVMINLESIFKSRHYFAN